MDQTTKKTVIELYDAAKNKEDQIKLMKELGFGTKGEILKALHEEGRALDIQARKKREDTMEDNKAWVENKTHISEDLKDYFMTNLETLDKKIKDIEADITDLNLQIQQNLEDKKKLEKIYKELFELTK